MTSSLAKPNGVGRFMTVTSMTLVAIFLVFVLTNLELVDSLQAGARDFVTRYFSGYLVWVVTIIMLFTIILAVSPFGNVRLGQDEEHAQFTGFAWFSMLFSAGVGTGILFYGVAEPIFHFQANPFLVTGGIEPLTENAAIVAQRVTLFHWGLHGWAIYSMVGLCLGYFAFRKGLPLTIRSALEPVFGERIHGPIGHTIDLLAILSTLFGIAVSLGLGASQISSGIEFLFDVHFTPLTRLVLIVLVSVIATVSAVSGVRRGIRRLSEINIWLSVGLIGFLLTAGPTLVIVSTFLRGTGDYFANFLPMGIFVDPDADSGWQGVWTIFYWGWWISWGPFVGTFMALISRGRTIRQYVLGTLLAPTIAGFLWLSVFGATALDLQLVGPGGLVEAVNADMTNALFKTFQLLDVSWATWTISLVATTLVVGWFVTSCDSGTLVLSIIASGGERNPPALMRILWGTLIGTVAGVLLLAGGLPALQAASTTVALPFSAVLLLLCGSLLRSLWMTERNRQLLE